MRLSQLEAWIANFMECLTKTETPDGHFQKLYANTCMRMMELEMEQLIRNVKLFRMCWAEDDLVVRADANVKNATRS